MTLVTGPAPLYDAASVGLVSLVARCQEDGDARAREELVLRLAPLTRRLAARYRSPHEPMEDLVQVASLGLLGAIDRFDVTRGCAFESYAIPTILGELRRHFRDTGWAAHVPRRAQELSMRVDRATRELTAQLGRPPRVPELTEWLAISQTDVALARRAGGAHYSMSLDAPAPARPSPAGEDADCLGDLLGGIDERLDLVDAKLSLAAAISRLPYIERVALRMRLRDGLMQVEIAERMGCSQMQVSRLLSRARERVRALTDPESRPAEL